MKKFFFSAFLFVFLFLSCNKDEFIYSYPETNKLLVSVKQTYAEFEFKSEFMYDSLNRLIEVKNIFPSEQVTIESYSYNDEGRIVEKRIDSYKTTYTYNEGGQLIEQNIHYSSPDNDYEWEQKTTFQYRSGRIFYGTEYSKEGEIMNDIYYKYDSRGNTIEKSVRMANSKSDFSYVKILFKYDTKVNPFRQSGVNMLNGYSYTQHPDINQVNNPIYSSYSNLLMSSIPPEYEISYNYDADGLPVKAEMKNLRVTDSELAIVEYEYVDIEK